MSIRKRKRKQKRKSRPAGGWLIPASFSDELMRDLRCNDPASILSRVEHLLVDIRDELRSLPGRPRHTSGGKG